MARRGPERSEAIRAGWKLPHWVYRAYTADDRLLYVGMTRNPESRFRSWVTRCYGRPPWVDQAARWTWTQYPNSAAASAAERDAIRSEHPVANVHHQRRTA